MLAFVSHKAFFDMRLVSTYFHWDTNYILGLEKAEKGLTTLISQKIVSHSSIIDHGKGPGFLLIIIVFGKKSFFIWQKSNLIQ